MQINYSKYQVIIIEETLDSLLAEGLRREQNAIPQNRATEKLPIQDVTINAEEIEQFVMKQKSRHSENMQSTFHSYKPTFNFQGTKNEIGLTPVRPRFKRENDFERMIGVYKYR